MLDDAALLRRYLESRQVRHADYQAGDELAAVRREELRSGGGYVCIETVNRIY